jgi:16S rRNA (guanine966-N2)-methyltransferase
LLGFPTVEGLRPTGDRIRETLFNWLTPYLPNSRCLDAFAGSGALGFEALSRGAGEVVFCEKSPKAASTLEQNKALLNAEHARILKGDTIQTLAELGRAAAETRQQFDIVFLDPPFSAHLHQKSLELLSQYGLVAPQGLLYLEKPVTESLNPGLEWQLFREKETGAVCCQLWIRD